nr:GNAT family N-acetyltransferase [uncultured Carboxylicivirga sp.]
MKSVLFQVHEAKYNEQLLVYLHSLSKKSTQLFGPHAFTIDALNELTNNNGYRLYTATYKQQIVAYCIIKIGWLDCSKPRFTRYGLIENYSDLTLAPSVADAYQGKGIGTNLLRFVLDDIHSFMEPGNIYLWGGVHQSNSTAIHLYKKFGFTILGEFMDTHPRYDMYLNQLK